VENFGQFTTKEKWYNNHYGIDICSVTKKEVVKLGITFTMLKNLKVYRHKLVVENDGEDGLGQI